MFLSKACRHRLILSDLKKEMRNFIFQQETTNCGWGKSMTKNGKSIFWTTSVTQFDLTKQLALINSIHPVLRSFCHDGACGIPRIAKVPKGEVSGSKPLSDFHTESLNVREDIQSPQLRNIQPIKHYLPCSYL